MFWLAFQLCRSSAHARRVVLALALAGLAYALYGLFALFAGGSGVVASTFVNRNNYATYAGITLLCALGLLLLEVERHARAHVSLRRTAVDLLARLDAPLGLALVTCLVAAAALRLTQSRGAFLALCAALAVFVWTLRRMALVTSRAVHRRGAVRGRLRPGHGVARRRGDPRALRGDRRQRAQAARVLRDHMARDPGSGPLLGTGYGTYADAFEAYNHPGTGAVFLKRAHNTYLQMIMELRLAGGGRAAALRRLPGPQVRPGSRRRATATPYLAVVVHAPPWSAPTRWSTSACRSPPMR